MLQRRQFREQPEAAVRTNGVASAIQELKDSSQVLRKIRRRYLVQWGQDITDEPTHPHTQDRKPE
eukprot:8358228-Pyramimonas_sp.AAC.1